MGELVTQADQISTAQNLSGSDNIPLPSAKSVPLSQRIKTALIYLIDEGTIIPLNRSGAAGWAYDDKLWLVSKRVLDALKKHMMEEGQRGIPSDNTRLMDELLQNDIIIPSEPGRAIWKVTVNIDSWKNNFTCLCFSMNKLWDDRTAWPEQTGNINIQKIVKEEPDNQEKMEKEKTKNKDILDKAPETKGSISKEVQNQEKKPVTDIDNLPLPPLPGIISNQSTTSQNETIDETNDDFEAKKRKHYGQAFVDWLSNGIADGSMPINVNGALVHTIGEEKTLLLVSPKIFRVFAKKYKDIDYELLQHDFQSMNLHKHTPENTNVWKFKTISHRKNKKANNLSGMIIENPEEKLNIRLPSGNSHITEL